MSVTKLVIICFTFCFSTLLISKTSINERPLVSFESNYGSITIRLFVDEAPISSENFLNYVRDGFYTDTLIHKVIDGFIIQGGGFDKNFKSKASRKPIRNESRGGLKNIKGTVAMALTTDVNSAASQFFINLADNGDLDYTTKTGRGFTVFAEVIDGFDVIEEIQKVRTKRITIYSDTLSRNVPMYNVPDYNVVITKATILRDIKK